MARFPGRFSIRTVTREAECLIVEYSMFVVFGDPGRSRSGYRIKKSEDRKNKDNEHQGILHKPASALQKS